ncbi:outer membrane protein OmpK [Parvibaculum sp.]|uniref:outer membrane protein OmpK n=1 Tax=Parvibaculum sp. TaxID=2024848 RepID=UPI00320ECE9B
MFVTSKIFSKAVGGAIAGGVMAVSLMAGASAQAADWSNTDIQYLYGRSFQDYDKYGNKIDDQDKGVVSIEHASGWSYGDNYFFFDVSNPFGGNDGVDGRGGLGKGTVTYGEWSPRLSVGKIFAGKELGFGGIVKDTFLAANFEYSSGDHFATGHSILVGPGFSLDLPGFAFADINFYARKSYRQWIAKDTSLGGQVTIDWLYPFTIGSTQWSFGGFLDYAFGEKGGVTQYGGDASKTNSVITQPQLLLDVGALIGAKPGVLKAGIEYDVWLNKYGIDGANESNPNIMVMYTF